MYHTPENEEGHAGSVAHFNAISKANRTSNSLGNEAMR